MKAHTHPTETMDVTGFVADSLDSWGLPKAVGYAWLPK